MNKLMMIGRLTRDPEVRYTQGQNPTAVARYTLAVDRRFKREGEQEADFVSCVAFGKNGEFAEKYLSKGMKIAVVGRLQTGSYEKDGQRIYTTDAVIEEHYFCESKVSKSSQGVQQSGQKTDVNGFMDVADDVMEDLPFA